MESFPSTIESVAPIVVDTKKAVEVGTLLVLLEPYQSPEERDDEKRDARAMRSIACLLVDR